MKIIVTTLVGGVFLICGIFIVIISIKNFLKKKSKDKVIDGIRGIVDAILTVFELGPNTFLASNILGFCIGVILTIIGGFIVFKG